MGTAANVKMGVCEVVFGTTNLGYTKGGVKVSFQSESTEMTVDQEDVPVGEVLTKQTFEVKVPLAEYDLAILAEILPSCEIGTDGTKKILILKGEAGANMLDTAKELVITPVDASDNDTITVFHAVAKPNIEFAFEKDNVRVYEVTFKALKGASGFVAFGDLTATAIFSVTPNSGAAAGGTAVVIDGTGFTGATGAKFDTTAATGFSVVDDNTINCTTPAHAAGAVTVAVTIDSVDKTKTTAFTYTA
jgi:hypothetical protein